jgi:hypothetical protein
MASRLSGGLSKLEQAATEVDALQKELSQAHVVVAAATEECNQLLEVISSNTADAETRQQAAREKEEALKEQSAQIEVGFYQLCFLRRNEPPVYQTNPCKSFSPRSRKSRRSRLCPRPSPCWRRRPRP